MSAVLSLHYLSSMLKCSSSTQVRPMDLPDYVSWMGSSDAGLILCRLCSRKMEPVTLLCLAGYGDCDKVAQLPSKAVLHTPGLAVWVGGEWDTVFFSLDAAGNSASIPLGSSV